MDHTIKITSCTTGIHHVDLVILLLQEAEKELKAQRKQGEKYYSRKTSPQGFLLGRLAA